MADQTLNIRPPLWLPIVVVIIGGAFYIAGKNIEAENDVTDEGTISVSGDGRVFAAPDIAEISLGFQSGRQPTAAAAMERLKASMDQVIEAVKDQGIEEKDIRSEYFYLNPAYDYADGRQIMRGFEANQSLRIKVRDLDKISMVLGAGTDAGANQAGSVNFTLDDPDAKQAEARQLAIEEAKEKAQELARQLGVRLGDIKSFSEGGGWAPPMYMERQTAAYGMGGADVDQKAVQLPPGEQEIMVSVTLVYELE